VSGRDRSAFQLPLVAVEGLPGTATVIVDIGSLAIEVGREGGSPGSPTGPLASCIDSCWLGPTATVSMCFWATSLGDGDGSRKKVPSFSPTFAPGADRCAMVTKVLVRGCAEIEVVVGSSALWSRAYPGLVTHTLGVGWYVELQELAVWRARLLNVCI